MMHKKKWYRPREIARLGLIRNSIDSNNEDSNYNYVLKLIKAGKLKAREANMGGKLTYWKVSEDEIMRYHGDQGEAYIVIDNDEETHEHKYYYFSGDPYRHRDCMCDKCVAAWRNG